MINLQQPRTRPSGVYNGIERYASLWMSIALVSSMESSAKRRTVGCAIVTESMGVYTGYNGVLAKDNNCEDCEGNTKPEVIHAESNALDKMLKEGVSSKNARAFITLSPCMDCAKRLVNSGVAAVYYKEEYKCLKGVKFLEENDIIVMSWDDLIYGSE